MRRRTTERKKRELDAGVAERETHQIMARWNEGDKRGKVSKQLQGGQRGLGPDLQQNSACFS